MKNEPMSFQDQLKLRLEKRAKESQNSNAAVLPVKNESELSEPKVHLVSTSNAKEPIQVKSDVKSKQNSSQNLEMKSSEPESSKLLTSVVAKSNDNVPESLEAADSINHVDENEAQEETMEGTV